MTIWCETMTIWARADLRELLHLSTTNNLLARRGMHDYVLHETCAYKAAAYNLYINVYAWLQSEASRAERKLSSFSTVWGEDTGATEVVLIRPTQGSLIRLWTKDALEKDLRRGSDMLRQVGFECAEHFCNLMGSFTIAMSGRVSFEFLIAFCPLILTAGHMCFLKWCQQETLQISDAEMCLSLPSLAQEATSKQMALVGWKSGWAWMS